MNIQNDIGTGEDEMFVTPIELWTAEIFGRELTVLDRCTHRAVEDDDSLLKQFGKGGIRHGRIILFRMRYDFRIDARLL